MKIKKIELSLKAKYRPAKEAVLRHIKSPFLRDTVTQLMIIPGLFLLLSGWVLAFYYFRAGEYLVPVRYNSFLGVFSLGSWYDSYTLPLLMLVCFLSNIFLGNVIYKKDKFLAYILAASNIFLMIIGITIIVNFGRMING